MGNRLLVLRSTAPAFCRGVFLQYGQLAVNALAFGEQYIDCFLFQFGDFFKSGHNLLSMLGRGLFIY